MTTGNSTSGGTALVNPTGSRLKHALRSSTRAGSAAVGDGDPETTVLVKEEEKLMDEEITSEEESEHGEKMERKMLTVALVKSVVDKGKSSGTGGGGDDDDDDDTDDSKRRYGLRKRRRPAGEDLKRLEHFQATNAGGLARSNVSQPKSVPPASVPLAPPPSSLIPSAAAAPPKKQKPKKSTTAASKVTPAASIPGSSSVPNPLASKPLKPPSILLPGTRSARSGSVSLPSNVPCPLPGRGVEDKKPESTVAMAVDSAEKRKVVINEGTRARGFSIDLDSVGLDFPDEGSAPAAGGRNRAFSFECFAFGINADEPLPPLGAQDADSTSMGRPRGDSIIFDPSSFHEGGIHEQSALERAKSSAASRPAHPGQPVPSSMVVAPVSAAMPAPAPVPSHAVPENLPHVPSFRATTTTTTTSSTTTTVTTTTAAGGTVSLELLNKEGRIGIYLPEARRARIARFHAKRAKRVWRKRIKYDCRKKLADSRPRIKGRFVKRSDMEG